MLQTEPPAPRASPPLPARPRSSAVTCTNGQPTVPPVTRRPRPLRPVPRVPASDGAKLERNPAAVRGEFCMYVAANVGVRVDGSTGPLGLPEFTTPVAVEGFVEACDSCARRGPSAGSLPILARK